MSNVRDKKRLKQLLTLAQLLEERLGSELRDHRRKEGQIAAELAALKGTAQRNNPEDHGFCVSGAAQLWAEWRRQEARKLSVRSARARVATEQARKVYAKSSARRLVLQRLSEGD